ncbi:MAG: hypothetical protein Kow0056_01540 [Coriobacteriia bacterium]
MVWRTPRGLAEPTPAGVIWMWAVPGGTHRVGADAASVEGLAGSPAPEHPDPVAVARRLSAKEGDTLFDPVEFALMGGWAFLNGTLPRSVN